MNGLLLRILEKADETKVPTEVRKGIARSSWEIIESSGTGEPAGIVGHGTFSSGLDDKACYSVIYSGI